MFGTALLPSWETILTFMAEYWYCVALALILYLIAYLGLFSSIEAKESTFPGGHFYYKNMQVSMTKLSPVFKTINADVASFYETLPKPMAFETGAIFYDDPSALVNEE